MALRSADEVLRRIADLGPHDAYEVLDVPRDATDERIAQAYRRAMAREHPDRGGSPAQAQLLNCAYEVLSRHRATYDLSRVEAARAARTPDDVRTAGDDLADADEPFVAAGEGGEAADGVGTAESGTAPPVEPDVVEEPPDDAVPLLVQPEPAEPVVEEAPHRQFLDGRLWLVGVALLVAAVVVMVGQQVTSARRVGTQPPPDPASAAAAATTGDGGQWTASRYEPSQALAGRSSATPASPSGSPSVVAPPTDHECVVRPDATLWCSGSGHQGQLGDGRGADSARPVRVGAPADGWLTVAVGAASSCALRADAGLWCWGDNGFGQLGDGTTGVRAAPVRIAPTAAWIAVAVSTHTCAVRSDHTLWCWGDGAHGELGDNGTSGRLVPTQVGGETTWAAVVVNPGRTCGLRQNGSSMCWGTAAAG